MIGTHNFISWYLERREGNWNSARNGCFEAKYCKYLQRWYIEERYLRIWRYRFTPVSIPINAVVSSFNVERMRGATGAALVR